MTTGQIITYPSNMGTGQVLRTPVAYVMIGRIRVDCVQWSTDHDVDRGIGTASITLPYTQLQFIDWNVPLTIMAGYRETDMGVVFYGYISGMRESYGENGPVYQIDAEGPLSRMTRERKDAITYGTIRDLKTIIANEAFIAGVQPFRADRVLFANTNSDVVMGGNRWVNRGFYTIDRGVVPFDRCSHLAKLFGYRVFDRPDGVARLQRISGKPIDPVLALSQGVNIFDIKRTRDSRQNANYWIVRGSRWQDANGVTHEAISQPDAVPSSGYYLGGWKRVEIADDNLHTGELASAVRYVKEIDHSIPSDTVSIEIEGTYQLMPGDVVRVRADDVRIGMNQERWVTSVSHRFSAAGFWTTISAWIGGGTPLNGGHDVVDLVVDSGNYHLGTRTIDNYLKPAPDGKVIVLNFTVPERYAGISLSARAHGTNSMWLETGRGDERVWEHQELTGSEIEVFQNGESVSRATLPMLTEPLDDNLDYTDDTNWHNIRFPLTGRLTEGPAVARIVADVRTQRGIETDDPDVDVYDEFEIKDIRITATGVPTTWVS